MNEVATKVYQRLCVLNGNKPPYGDCQLIALMLQDIQDLAHIIYIRIIQENCDDTKTTSLVQKKKA
jgi:hypothetical protein